MQRVTGVSCGYLSKTELKKNSINCNCKYAINMNQKVGN